MRVRIVRKPPANYSGLDAEPLMVGRVYNLAAALASALMLDGYAESYDTLTPEEKRERAGEATHVAWTSDDHVQRWAITPRKKR